LAALVAKAESDPFRTSLLDEQVGGVTSQIGMQIQLAEIETGSVDPGQVMTPAATVGWSHSRAYRHAEA
jgi:hypothetical protein